MIFYSIITSFSFQEIRISTPFTKAIKLGWTHAFYQPSRRLPKGTNWFIKATQDKVILTKHRENTLQ